MIVPIGIVSGVFLMLSLRLLRSALRLGGPEGWLAGFFFGGALAMPVRVMFAQGWLASGDHEYSLLLATHGLMTAALTAYTLFIGRVFRPDAAWASAITASLIGAQVVAPLAVVFFGGHRDEQHPVNVVVHVVRALPFVWGFLESYAYYGRMKKRATLGLADPVVTNRFALFAIWNGALFLVPTTLVGLRLWALATTESGSMLGEGESAQLILGLARLVLLGLVATMGVSLWLSFFPPKLWRERLERRAETLAS